MSFYILKLLYNSLIITFFIYFIVEQLLSTITAATRRSKLTLKANRLMDI